MASVYQLVTKPKDCAFVLGLPVTKDDFYRSREMEASDYAKRFWHWPEYCREFLDDYRLLRRELVRFGVHMIEYAGIHDFHDVWNHGYHAVVLFSHWNGDGIEYREGIVSLEEVVRAIPRETLGTLDLSVCHPQRLVDMLKVTHRPLLTKSIWEPADPKYWCMFYGALFILLQSKEISYPEGLHEIADGFITRSARIKGAEK
jgi:hypothetical protein